MSVPTTHLSSEEINLLLHLARQALEYSVRGKSLPELDLSVFPDNLRSDGASFVTLTKNGELRGCIGALEAYQPLVMDVIEHAIAAGFNDYRFSPLIAEELREIQIEISRLTKPQSLTYSDPLELPNKLKPGIDGVILRDGWKRATFLPQVWEKLPEPEEFLNHLCYKMGSKPDLWKWKILEVFTYEVEEFHE